eukprot:COSAG05_NODE_3231_length_2221_cov_6.577286_2_plen_90_part_00
MPIDFDALFVYYRDMRRCRSCAAGPTATKQVIRLLPRERVLHIEGRALKHLLNNTSRGPTFLRNAFANPDHIYQPLLQHSTVARADRVS